MIRIRSALLALLLALLPLSPAAAWWDYGHQMVARIAWAQIRPATRAALQRLLAQSRRLDTPTCPARTLAQASTWPDCVKTLGDRFSYAYAWHYQDFDVCTAFTERGTCPGGQCVTAQIERNQRLLADRTLNPRERLMALIFLVHLVGDLHQPLHAAERDGDQGGNKAKALYGRVPSNLHSIWDGLLAERALTTPPAGVAGLLSAVPPAERAAVVAGRPLDWARESWGIARDTVYPSASGGAPACPAQPGPGHLDEAAIQRLTPLVRAQIAKGGLRLAAMLDAAVAGRVPPRRRGG
ncbi:S1/P1 nuclease [Sphingomonas morindae]|uniref:S1/P1 nuclease n=1 Tax=Sphingomonas morindae TaxID=1541170 RepID=A0ABY4XB57_9SPHN|nr:S1/P1 nuclease [Sphingomonas morindae]USI74153.1 S1/P1 nuclease [Sphingomonas morindae]